MVSIYLGNWQLFSSIGSDEIELPVADPELTLGEKVGLWPIPDSISTDAPKQGDFIIFIGSSGDIYGCGRVGGISTEESTVDYILEMMSSEVATESIGAVATIVQYQESEYHSRRGRPNLENIFKNFDSDNLDTALETGYPPGSDWVLQKLPDSFWHDDRSPSVILNKINGVSASGFYSDPGGGRDPERNYSPEGFDNDGSGGVVDRTGTLLEQQYVGRDRIRDASKASLQIAILLFGVIVAGLSLFRGEIEEGVINVQTPAIAGGLLIGIGALLAALVFIHTAVRPRPYAEFVIDQQSNLNEILPGIPSEERESELAKFSNIYHNAVNQVGIRNRILGGLVGAAVGISIGGIFVSVFGIIYQVGWDRALTGGIILFALLLAGGLTIYAAFVAQDTYEKLDSDWESEKEYF